MNDVRLETKWNMAVKRKERKCNAGHKYLFYHRTVVNVPVLFMKWLLTVSAVPVSGRGRFYSVIPELALLPPTNLFGGELGGFEGRGGVLGGSGTLR